MAFSISAFSNLRPLHSFARTAACCALLLASTIALAEQDVMPAQSAMQQHPSPSQPTPISSIVQLPPEQMGDIQMARRHYQAAIEQFTQVAPKSAAVWNKIGIAYQQMFVVEMAKKSYEKSLRMDSRNPNVLNNLGSVYYSLQMYKDAESFYRKALKYAPKSALIYKNLGTDMMAQNKFKKGWECFQSAMAIDPEIFERNSELRIGEPTPVEKRGAMNYYLAKSYAQAGMSDRAVDYLRMAIDEGYTDRKKVMADKEFASLHGFSAFEQLLAEQRTQ